MNQERPDTVLDGIIFGALVFILIYMVMFLTPDVQY